MNILVVGTVNGKKNEGMRNVITNLSKSFEKENHVEYTNLKDIRSTIRKAKLSDTIIVCAKANLKTYILCKLLGLSCYYKSLYFLIVQKPDEYFLKYNKVSPIKCCYLAINAEDTINIKQIRNYGTYEIKLGIDSIKFKPIPLDERRLLRIKYGFELERPIVLHVGHCSTGRGLETLCSIDSNKYQRVMVASGLFEDEAAKQMLNDSGVKTITGYLQNVEELYQIADAYLFPTLSRNHVISIPLSIMEALSCGTPVVAFKEWQSLSHIKTTNEYGIQFVSADNQIIQAIDAAIKYKSDSSLLKNGVTWDEAADEVIEIMRGRMK